MFKSVMLEADKLLIKSGISELPLSLDDLIRIANTNGWILDSYENNSELLSTLNLVEFSESCPAFTLRRRGRYFIFYRENLALVEKIPIIAHEFGHIVLNHITDSKQDSIALSTSHEESVRQEAEADAFARELLAPAAVMKKCGITTHKKITKLNLIGGAYKYEQLAYINNSTFTSCEEIELCEHFKRYIFRTKFCYLKLSLQIIAVLTLAVALVCFIFFNTMLTDHTNTGYVFITKSGEKYHKNNCPYIAHTDRIKIEISEAMLMDYEPCKYCYSE